MVPRKKRAYQLVEWVGSDKLTLIEPARGWPSLFDCKVGNETVRIAAYLAGIGLSHRGRDDRERRFQNPAKGHPVVAPKNDEIPFMLGMTTEFKKQRTLVGMNAYKRIGKPTRQSLFVPLRLLHGVIGEKWNEQVNAADERLVAFVPELLPRFIEDYRSQRVAESKQIEADF